MSQQLWIESLPGERLVKELVARRGLDAAGARAWIEGETGQAYEARSIYEVRWGGAEGDVRRVSRRRPRRPRRPPHEAWKLG